MRREKKERLKRDEAMRRLAEEERRGNAGDWLGKLISEKKERDRGEQEARDREERAKKSEEAAARRRAATDSDIAQMYQKRIRDLFDRLEILTMRAKEVEPDIHCYRNDRVGTIQVGFSDLHQHGRGFEGHAGGIIGTTRGRRFVLTREGCEFKVELQPDWTDERVYRIHIDSVTDQDLNGWMKWLILKKKSGSSQGCFGGVALLGALLIVFTLLLTVCIQ